VLEVRSGPQVPTFRNSTYSDPQVGLTRDLGTRQWAQKLMCFLVLKASNKKYAHIGDVIIAMVKEAIPNMLLKKLIVRAIIVHIYKKTQT
jgi:hypothetical protein